MRDVFFVDFRNGRHTRIGDLPMQKKESRMNTIINQAFIRNDPELTAARIRALYGETNLSFPVVEFAKSLGIEHVVIDFSELHNAQSGNIKINGYLGIYSDKKQKPRIAVSANESIGHQNWTTAHELWHYMNHSIDVATDVYYTENADDYGGNSPNDEENMANRFAAALLMPEQSFSFAYSNTMFWGRKKRVASLFDVSETAVQMRAVSLGLA